MSNDQSGDILIGMKAICQHLHNISEATALKWQRELALPIRKSDKDGSGGIWISSRKKLNEWTADFVGQ